MAQSALDPFPSWERVVVLTDFGVIFPKMLWVCAMESRLGFDFVNIHFAVSWLKSARAAGFSRKPGRQPFQRLAFGKHNMLWQRYQTIQVIPRGEEQSAGRLRA
jgi:hypothetical protein